jgi:hypothetical protein
MYPQMYMFGTFLTHLHGTESASLDRESGKLDAPARLQPLPVDLIAPHCGACALPTSTSALTTAEDSARVCGTSTLTLTYCMYYRVA